MLLVVEYKCASSWLSYIVCGEIYSMNIPQWWMLALFVALQFSDWQVRYPLSHFKGYNKVDERSCTLNCMVRCRLSDKELLSAFTHCTCHQVPSRN